MGKYIPKNAIDLSNKQFGCWKFTTRSESRISNSGTLAYWNVICTNCNNTFEYSTRNMMCRIKQGRHKPECCRLCDTRNTYYRDTE